MLFVFHGENVTARKQALDKLRQGLLEKRADAEVFEIDADEFTAARIQELTTSRGLFEDKYIVFLFHVLTTEVGQEAIIPEAKTLKETDHVFVLVEEMLPDKHLKKLKPHAHSIQEFTGGPEKAKYKPWPLSDAYGRRDKKASWLELQDGQAAGQQPEALHGLLVWQTRLMLLAKECGSAKEAGESGYPFKKAQGFSKNFSQDELEDNFRRLVKSYHEAHRGRYDLFSAMEQFLLEI